MNRNIYVMVVLLMSISVFISTTIEASAVPEVQRRSICACPRMYVPVCASNGVTYGNTCTFNCAASKVANLKIMREGECDDDDGIWEEIAHKLKLH